MSQSQEEGAQNQTLYTEADLVRPKAHEKLSICDKSVILGLLIVAAWKLKDKECEMQPERNARCRTTEIEHTDVLRLKAGNVQIFQYVERSEKEEVAGVVLGPHRKREMR